MISVYKMGKGSAAGLYLTAQKQDYYAYDEIKKLTQFYDPHSIFNGLHAQPVEPEAFKRICAARDPFSNEKLIEKADENHIAGIDFTFSAPKSYSILHALSSTENQHLLDQIHKQSIIGTINYLIAHGGYTRIRKGNQIIYKKCPLATAIFPHHETRDGDPQEHVHVTFFNLTRDQGGKYRSIENRSLLFWRAAAAARYHVAMAEKLKEIGILTAREERNFSCIQIPQDLCNLFSKRRKTIIELAREVRLYLEASQKGMKIEISDSAKEVLRRVEGIKPENCDITKYENRRFADVFSLVSRPDKPHVVYEDYLKRWREQASKFGLTMDDVEQIISRQSIVLDDKSKARIQSEIIKETLNEITLQSSVFTENQLHQMIGEKAIGLLSIDELDGVIDKLYQSNELVFVKKTESDLRQFTSINQIKLEVGLVYSLHESKANFYHLLQEDYVDNTILQIEQEKALESRKSFKFTEEKMQVIKKILSDTGSICALEGIAGSGKSDAQRVINKAYVDKGYTVIGAAYCGEAAQVLETKAHIKSQTVDSLLLEIRREERHIDKKTIVVIDEAGMMGARKAYTLLAEVLKAGGKAIFTGDQQQLLPLDAGQVLRVIFKTIGTQFLTQIFRQATDPNDSNPNWRLDLVRKFIEGDSQAALKELADRQLINLYDTDNMAMLEMVEKWFNQFKNNEQVLMLAAKNYDANAISDIARRMLIADKAIDIGYEVTLDTPYGLKSFAVGDSIITTFNSKKRHGLINGTRGIVQDIQPSSTADNYIITLKTSNNQLIKFDTASYRNFKGKIPLTYGYCSTVYRGQGKTTDNALVYASTYLDRRTAYVAFSRAKYNTELFIGRESWKHLIEKESRENEVTIGDKTIIERITRAAAKLEYNDLAIDILKNEGFNIKEILNRYDNNLCVSQIKVNQQHPFNLHYYETMGRLHKQVDPVTKLKSYYSNQINQKTNKIKEQIVKSRKNKTNNVYVKQNAAILSEQIEPTLTELSYLRDKFIKNMKIEWN